MWNFVGEKPDARIRRSSGCPIHSPAGDLELTFSDVKSDRIYTEIYTTCVSRHSPNPHAGAAAGIKGAQHRDPRPAQLVDCLADRVPNNVVGVSAAR
jgi:hypothetical protein